MKSSEIRNKFLSYFEAKGHKVLPGSSLIPADPTVLLTLAGMLQFKPVFLGQEKPQFRRAATVQKCIRMVDVERVGRTSRHHTFFEMLGNFSFGDYFKKEAIQFAWELLTKEFKLPVTRLKIAVYEKDHEAFDIWHKNIGLPEGIIYRLGEENNFWAVGPTGPCGPCSEIYYDLGEELGCARPDCGPGCDCDRFLEIWNLVFIEYNRNDKGELVPLQQKGIDTGMGLERISAVLQGVSDNFETDIFFSLLKKIESLSAVSEPPPASRKIIADHSRAITHLIADGVFPGNTGRGYVLRRLIRRTVSHGRRLGIVRPFLADLAGVVIENMSEPYPNLARDKASIERVIGEEEGNFFKTLEEGMRQFEQMMGEHQADKILSGDRAFKLHDTYGFPVELTVELCGEKGCRVDLDGFNQLMTGQRERARISGFEGEKKKQIAGLDLSALKPTNFTGYEKTSEDSKVAAVFPEQSLIVLEKTPFYGESGGQAGDTGIIAFNHQEVRVVNAFITPRGVILHELDRPGDLKVNAGVRATIDAAKRKATEAHHTATHLLHKALREVAGEHARQTGSYVGPDKLRFDFSHFHALTCDELQKIEAIVNRKIKDKLKVEVLKKSYQEAVKLGAMALFGEKYGEQVRVLKIGDYSLELCGGTHVRSTAEIHYFKIISEGALGSGVRRLEALAGQAAKVHILYEAKSLAGEIEALLEKYRRLQKEKGELGGVPAAETNIFEIEVTELERLCKAVDNQDSANVNKFLDHLRGRAEWLKERVIKAEREIETLKEQKAKGEAADFAGEVREIGGKKVLLKEFKEYNMELLRAVSDSLQASLKSCVLLLASVFPGRVIYLIAVTPDLVAVGLSARNLAGVFSAVVGGKGGGKDTKVEGGGKYPANISEGFDEAVKLLQ